LRCVGGPWTLNLPLWDIGTILPWRKGPAELKICYFEGEFIILIVPQLNNLLKIFIYT
jgi:hypothetical protein